MTDTVTLASLGLDPSAPDAADIQKLIDYVAAQGATEDEIKAAAESGTLGPLALELALRPSDETISFADAAAQAGLELADAAALWRALGLADPLVSEEKLAPDQAQTLRVLAAMGNSLLGMETTLQLARVIGGALTQIAQAIVDAFRVRVELPRLGEGQAFSDVVADYARTGAELLPPLGAAITDMLRTHVVRASRSSWATDEERSTVTRDAAIGFVDLVDYTSRSRSMSPAALAESIGKFEAGVADVVDRHGGRVVKLIGDAAMFAAEDPQRGNELALDLIEALSGDPQLGTVRVGMAAGPVVALYGDYYGDVVNLASRLVGVARPGEVLVSEQLAQAVPPGASAEPVEVPALKGYEQPVTAFRLERSST